jgi:hypothetical protein
LVSTATLPYRAGLTHFAPTALDRSDRRILPGIAVDVISLLYGSEDVACESFILRRQSRPQRAVTEKIANDFHVL